MVDSLVGGDRCLSLEDKCIQYLPPNRYVLTYQTIRCNGPHAYSSQVKALRHGTAWRHVDMYSHLDQETNYSDILSRFRKFSGNDLY
jgi:hypothetical protein